MENCPVLSELVEVESIMTKLVISATELETALLLKELGCMHQGRITGFNFCLSEHNHMDVCVVRSDPGIANAAAATAACIERFSPEMIFNIGVCGVYSDDMNLLAKVVAGTSAVFADAGAETDDSFSALDAIDLPLAETETGIKIFNIIRLNSSTFSNDLLKGVFLTVGASSGTRQRAQEIKSRFKFDDKKLLCEDMESAAVGLIALKNSIPCTVLRGISNLCGERDHEKWKLTEASEAAQTELLKCL